MQMQCCSHIKLLRLFYPVSAAHLNSHHSYYTNTPPTVQRGSRSGDLGLSLCKVHYKSVDSFINPGNYFLVISNILRGQATSGKVVSLVYDSELTATGESLGDGCMCVHTLSGCPFVHRFLSSPLFMPSAKKVPAQIWYFVKTNKTIEQNKKTGTYPEDMA